MIKTKNMTTVISVLFTAALTSMLIACILEDARKAATKKRITKIRDNYTPETDKSELTFEDLMESNSHE